MDEGFYSVVLENSSNEYYFKSREHACAFLLESFSDDYPEEDISYANEQLADNDYIESYGGIYSCWFED